MITSNLIPLMKLYRLKTYLPINDTKKTMNSVVILNNPDIQSNMKFLEHPLFLPNSKYNTYFIEPRYAEKIRSKTVRINYKEKRNYIYEDIKDKYRHISFTPLTGLQLANRNMYYDLSVYNDIFFSNIGKTSIRNKIELYFGYLRKIVDSQTLNGYNLKTVFIDVEAWTKPGMSDIDNAVSYIYIAFKKYIEYLEILGDMDIIFYTDKICFKFNPSKVSNKNDFLLFKKFISMLSKNINYTDDSKIDVDEEEPEVDNSKEDKDDYDNNVKFPTSIDNTEDESEELKFNSSDIIDNEEDVEDNEDINNDTLDNIENDIADEIDITDIPDDENFGDISAEVKRNRSLREPLSAASQKRNEELKVLQKDIKLDDFTIDELINLKPEEVVIDENDISDKITSTNENIKNIRFSNFEKVYNEKIMKSDMMKIITNLNKKSIPTYVRKITVEDSSDELNYKETYNIQLEDANRVRHSLTFDVPKFIDDKFLYINGSRKHITKQLFMKPISKTGRDEVQICSNYNKIFVRRHGNKTSPQIEKFKKITSEVIPGLTIKRGNVSKNNTSGLTPLEYDELSKIFISVKTKDFEIMFDQKEIDNRLKGTKIPNGQVCVGFYNTGKPILLNIAEETINGLTIIEYIVETAGGKLKDSYDSIKAGTTRFIYSDATIMGEKVPLVLLLGYCEGLSTVLRKAKINYRFTDKRPSLDSSENAVAFSDGYLIYETKPFKNDLLLNALHSLPTKLYPYDEFDEQEVYVDLFDTLYGSRNLANAFNTFYEFMIDPITEEILTKLNLPTDFVSVLLEANSLLANNSYLVENNMNLFRIRSNEIVNGIIHQEITKAYARYRDTASTKNPVKMSIKKDQIIKRLLEVNTVEEFSILNPIYEVEKFNSISPRGLNGMNSERAFTPDKRAYDSTMTGVIGISTSNDANVGVVRKLTIEPTVMDSRGFIDVKDSKLNELKDVNLFTYSEMLTPLGVSHDDSVRTAMKFYVAYIE